MKILNFIKIGIFRERNSILGKVVFFKKDKKINDEFYYFKNHIKIELLKNVQFE